VDADLPRVRPFLTAEWRYLAMLNYRVPPELLAPLVPAGTTLDTFGGATYMTLVAFMFSNTRVLGAGIPLHRTFEEVNLRFYVRRRSAAGEVRRGVVFVRELVPRRAIALLARAAYNEPYVTLPMTHDIAPDARGGMQLEYRWQTSAGWCAVRADAQGPPVPIASGSHEEFITEHYWGYTRQRDGGTVEYRVTHPRWNVWHAQVTLDAVGLETLYGARFAEVLREPPDSAFVADGSPVAVHFPRRLPPDAPS
jgi:uncharacterized protein YqjF (DUF2071 family)